MRLNVRTVAVLVFGLAGFASAAGERGREWPATKSELYTLSRLNEDAERIKVAEAKVEEMRKEHAAALAEFVRDAVKLHDIKVEPGETVGWWGPTLSFYVEPAKAAKVDAGSSAAPVATSSK